MDSKTANKDFFGADAFSRDIPKTITVYPRACVGRRSAVTILTIPIMHILFFFALALLSMLAIHAACTTAAAFDILRSRTEDLGPELHQRATWRDVWSSLFPRADYPKGAGFVRSSFKIARSEPSVDEEPWTQIQALNASTNTDGAGNLTYNQVYVGAHEDLYKPTMFGLMGPLINQDDLTMYWNSPAFWSEFFQSMEKRNMRSISNRLGNVYRQYCYKAACNSNFGFIAGDIATQPAPTQVNLSGLVASPPTSELTQEMLDFTAVDLMQEGAQDGDTNGWITMGENGPEFPLYIGIEASNRILLNNSELRSDFNNSFMGRGDINPVIKRMGAKRVIKNFRHIPNLFPARWALMAAQQTINFQTAGQDSTHSVQATLFHGIPANINPGDAAASPWNGVTPTVTGGITHYYTLDVTGVANFYRIPTYCQSTQSADVNVGAGQAAVINGAWRDPLVAKYESAEVLNPQVMTEEVLLPVNSLPGAKLNAQNYYGEWNFVTGNDALLGIGGCTGVTDPMKKKGRHFGEYRHALKPVFHVFGRLLLFIRCSSSWDTVTCS